MNRIIIQGGMSHASGPEITKLLTTTAGSELVEAGALPISVTEGKPQAVW
jgi:hypothetical protein